jgi:predicted unusual protein kinase regulating ubiquinone biosynthesis (AarF/ABC1/UbiB family)
MGIYDFLDDVCFLCNLGIIIAKEGLSFLIFRNYPQMIKNIASSLSKQNVLYTKLFQSIALNHYLVDNVINNEILKYTDSVPFSEEDVDYELFEKLKDYFDFTEIPKPINSGMISLVYKMRLNATQNITDLANEVIVKIKRKNIDKKINEGIKRVKFFGWLGSFIPLFKTMHFPTILEKLIANLNDQLDFQKEANNINETREACKPMSYVRVPVVYMEFTEKFDIIVMEYLHGIPITKVRKNDYEMYGKMIIKYAFASFYHGIVHGDLHSGNILFMEEFKEGAHEFKIGIIDFGLMVRLKEDIKTNISNVFPDLFTKPGAYLAKKIFVNLVEHDDYFHSVSEKEIDDMCEIGGKLIDDFKARKKSFFESVSEIIFYLNTCIEKKNGKINDDYAKLQIAFAMTHGLSIELFNDNYVACMDEVMNELFHYNVFTD